MARYGRAPPHPETTRASMERRAVVFMGGSDSAVRGGKSMARPGASPQIPPSRARLAEAALRGDAGRGRTMPAALAWPAAAGRSRVVLPSHARVSLRPETLV